MLTNQPQEIGNEMESTWVLESNSSFVPVLSDMIRSWGILFGITDATPTGKFSQCIPLNNSNDSLLIVLYVLGSILGTAVLILLFLFFLRPCYGSLTRNKKEASEHLVPHHAALSFSRIPTAPPGDKMPIPKMIWKIQ